MNLPNRVARALSSKVPQVFCNQMPDGWYEVGHMDRDGPISESSRHVSGKYHDYTEALTQMQAHQFQLSARIAIAAMREPTDDMIHQGFCQLPTFFANEREDSIVPAWHAMVDAALVDS